MKYILFALLMSIASQVGAEDDLSPSPETPATQWEIIMSTTKNIVVKLSTTSSVVTIGCNANSECAMSVVFPSGCVPGSKYPLLINSTKRVGVVPSVCGLTSQGPAVLVSDASNLVKTLGEGGDISIAFPTTPGSIEVLGVGSLNFRDQITSGVNKFTTPENNSVPSPLTPSDGPTVKYDI